MLLAHARCDVGPLADVDARPASLLEELWSLDEGAHRHHDRVQRARIARHLPKLAHHRIVARAHL